MLPGKIFVLISILLNGYASADSCENDNCSSSIDSPLISMLNAPLKAELDISSLTKQLKKLIQKEVKVAVSEERKNLVENVLDKRIQTALDSFEKSYNLTLSSFKQIKEGKSLANHVKFTTADRQNDGRPKGANCAKDHYGGPWWYSYGCGSSDLNGEYVNGSKGIKSGHGLVWHHWKGFSDSMKVTKMMIRKK